MRRVTPPDTIDLAYLRFLRALTQADLSREAGVPIETIQRIEQRKCQRVKGAIIVALAHGLRMPWRSVAAVLERRSS